MKQATIIFLSIFTLSSFGQKQSGNGDGSFSLSIQYLQKIPDQKITNLEQDMLSWSYNERKSAGYSWNDETQDHDIPSYSITYSFSYDGEYTEYSRC